MDLVMYVLLTNFNVWSNFNQTLNTILTIQEQTLWGLETSGTPRGKILKSCKNSCYSCQINLLWARCNDIGMGEGRNGVCVDSCSTETM